MQYFIIFILLNTCYGFSLLNDTFSIIFCEKPNFFYSFLFLLSLMQHYSKLYFVRGSTKEKLLSKIHLITTVTQWWIPPRKYFNLIDVVYKNMSSKVSYTSYSFNILYDILHRGFPFSIT